MDTLIIYLNNIQIDDIFISTIKDSKDIFLGFIAAIFAIFIPLVIHYYSTLEKSVFPYLDSEIFTTKYFNIYYILQVLFLMLLWILLLTVQGISFFVLGFTFFIWAAIFSIILLINLYKYLSKKYSWEELFKERKFFLSNNNFNEIVVLEFLQNTTWKEPIFYLDFFYNKILEYDINFLNSHSKLIIESLLNKWENEDNFDIIKLWKFLEKIKLTDLFLDILNRKDIFNDYHFTKQFFNIFFKKINLEINKCNKWDWATEQLIRNLFFSYKKLKENSSILNSFQDQDFKLLLNIYKSDNENKYSYLSWDIMKTIISKMEKISWDTYLIIESLKTFLEKENDNFRFKFLSHFHSTILDSKILLEELGFMKEYWKDIFTKYKDVYFNETTKDWKIYISWKLQNGIFQELISLLWKKEGDYNHWYDNILQYWLLDFEPILFTELLYLYFIWYGENKALSIIETKRAFWWIGRLMTTWSWEKTFEEQEKELREKTIINFYETFKNNMPNFDELISQFKKLEKNEKLSERDILKSQHYIKLIKELQAIQKDEK